MYYYYCYYYYLVCLFLHLYIAAWTVCAGQWKMAPSHSAGVHAVRLRAPPLGQARLQHLASPTSVQALPSQAILIFVLDPCPKTGRSHQEVEQHNICFT